MKRLISFVLFLVFVISILPVYCAANASKDVIITYFEDGSYLMEKIIVNQQRASGTKSGAKELTYYESSGSAEWKAILNGTFVYTGSSASCTVSSISVTIYDSNWYTISRSSSKSGNTAYGSVIMGYKMLGVTVDEISRSISLQCDNNGNLS